MDDTTSRDLDSKFIKHCPCPKCGSSDAFGIYSDGHGFCFSCNTYFKGDNESFHVEGNNKKMSKECVPLEELSGEFRAITARGLSEDTCRKFKYYVGNYNGKAVQVACYCDDAGNIVGQKFRYPNKSFAIYGNVTNHLYGAQLWGSGGKMLVVTEGEIDCLTVSQLQDNKYPVVSIPNGAQGAKKCFEENLEYLSSFDKVIIMFDMDEAGRKGAEECAKVLPVGKAYIATLPFKDPNECLKEGHSAEVIKAIWNAKIYRPDGIVCGSDLYSDCVEHINDFSAREQYPWSALNEKTYGVGFGELITITSGSGMGKSTLLRELEYYFGVTKGQSCGIVALEESNRKTGLELMSIGLSKRLIFGTDSTSTEQLSEAFHRTIGSGRFFLYDHFGSLDSNNLLSKLRYMIVALGCRNIFLDHISIVVSGMDTDGDGGERKAIDKLMTNLRSLVEETQCRMFVVSHLKRPEKKGHEEGGQVSLSQLRGSGAIAQLSDMVIGLERNQQGDTPNILTIRVLKNRFSGDTGVSGYLEYNPETGRLIDFNSEESIAGNFTDETQQGDY